LSALYDSVEDAYAPSRRLLVTPTLSVIIASFITTLPIIANAPLLPPLGLLMLLSWRLMRSDVWPIWIGIPLGFVDDLVSGQPVGSAVALWTILMLAIDMVDRRIVWRDYWVDWMIGGFALLFALIGGALLARVGNVGTVIMLIGPQWLISLFMLPLFMLLVARLDAWRLRR
jgi:rod shape-determining protein MreD